MDTKKSVGFEGGTGGRSPRHVRFTDLGIRSLPPGDGRPVDYSDAVQRGLRLRVSPSGERTFLLAYRRPGDRKARKLALGSLADGLTLAQARREAAALLALLRREPPVDPAEARARRREAALAEAEAVRFAAACDAFAEEEFPAFRRATAAGWRRYIDKEIKPALGHLRPEEITPAHLADLRASIERGVRGPMTPDGEPTWKRKPAPVAARRCFEVLRRVFRWLSTADPEIAHARRQHGIARLDVSPADAARAFRRQSRSGRTRATAAAKVLTDAQLSAAFAAAEEEAQAASKGRQSLQAAGLPFALAAAHEAEARAFSNLFALVSHTAVRAHDARSARWEDIDLGRGLWTIPVHKTSDLTGAPHVVPLSEGAKAALSAAREANLAAGFGRSAWVFPADTGPCDTCGEPGHADKDAKATARVKRAAGIEGRGLLHRMRDTIKTRMSEHGIDGRVSEAILAHVPPGIVGTYDHAELLPQRREALEWWSGELARILSGDPEPGAGRAREGR